MLDSGFIIEDKYEVIKVLGSGGMGTVYLCKNISLSSLWAIKEIIKDGRDEKDILTEPNFLKEFNHPGIPRIIDVYNKEDSVYLVEEYIEGQTLKDYVESNGSIPPETMCSMIMDICNIIGYLHSFTPPVIYRDLKPSNIMITPEGKVILIDFGIAKSFKVNKNNDTLVMGSIGYAAPEQLGLGQSCKQTDIYGIGMVMFFMLNGKTMANPLEFAADTKYENNIKGDLKKIIQKCVKFELKERYSTIEELSDEISGCLDRVTGEKTEIFTEIFNESVLNQHEKVKNRKLGKHLAGFLILIIMVTTVLYIFFSNEKKYNDVQGSSSAETKSSDSEPVQKTQNTGDLKVGNEKISEQSGNSNDKEELDNIKEILKKQHKGAGTSKKKKGD